MLRFILTSMFFLSLARPRARTACLLPGSAFGRPFPCTSTRSRARRGLKRALSARRRRLQPPRPRPGGPQGAGSRAVGRLRKTDQAAAAAGGVRASGEGDRRQGGQRRQGECERRGQGSASPVRVRPPTQAAGSPRPGGPAGERGLHPPPPPRPRARASRPQPGRHRGRRRARTRDRPLVGHGPQRELAALGQAGRAPPRTESATEPDASTKSNRPAAADKGTAGSAERTRRARCRAPSAWARGAPAPPERRGRGRARRGRGPRGQAGQRARGDHGATSLVVADTMSTGTPPAPE